MGDPLAVDRAVLRSRAGFFGQPVRPGVSAARPARLHLRRHTMFAACSASGLFGAHSASQLTNILVCEVQTRLHLLVQALLTLMKDTSRWWRCWAT